MFSEVAPALLTQLNKVITRQTNPNDVTDLETKAQTNILFGIGTHHGGSASNRKFTTRYFNLITRSLTP